MRLDLTLKKILSSIDHARSSDTTRPALYGVRIDTLAGFMRASATDGHRLVHVDCPPIDADALFDIGAEGRMGVIPGPVVDAILKATRKAPEVQVAIRSAAEYPNLEKITRRASEMVEVGTLKDPAEAEETLRRIAKLEGGIAAVVLTATRDGMLRAVHEQHEPGFDVVADARISVVDADTLGNLTEKVGINARYLADAIRLARSNVRIHVSRTNPHLNVMRITGNCGETYLMPCRL